MDSLSVKLILISGLLILLNETPLIRPVQTVSRSVSLPLQYGIRSIGHGLKSEWEFWQNLRRLGAENQTQKQQILELESRLSREKEVLLENELLRVQLNLNHDQAFGKMVLARVVGQTAGAEGALLILDKGERSGLKSGQAVIYKNYLLGLLAEVFPESARLRLITDPKSRISAIVQGVNGRTRGVVIGEYAVNLRMEKILPNQEINPGDKVITAGEGGYPAGFLLGEVVETSKVSADVLKWARLKTLVDISSLEEAFVLTDL